MSPTPPPGERGEDQQLQEAGAAVEAERAAQMRGAGLPGAAAEPGAVDHEPVVAARPAEPQPERGGDRRLRPAGVGRAVARRVTRGQTQHRDRTTAGQGEPERGEPRGGQVREVVEARGGAAEAAVAGREMADHAVGGVERLVEGDPRQAEQRAPERGRHDRVGEVLGQALDRRAQHRRLVEAAGPAADDARQPGARDSQPRRREGVADLGDVAVQAALREQGAGEQRERQVAAAAGQQPAQGGLQQPGRACRHAEHRGESQRAARRGCGRVGLGVQPALERLDQRPDPDHRMARPAVEPVRVAEGGFQEQGEAGQSHGACRIAHGGALGEAERAFPDAPRPFLDLSTGINPRPYPLPALPPASLRRLPEARDLAALEAAAADAYGCRDAALVVAAPGTQLLISLLPHLRRAAHATVLGPTYAEHAAAWRAAGARVREVADPDVFATVAARHGGAAVLCNPNNPDGRRIGRTALLALAGRMARADGLLLVDEAFADLEQPDPGLAGELPHPGLALLRSFGKSYGLAGVRLGFLLAPRTLGDRVRAALGPWAVSGVALAAGLAALPDRGWRATAARRCAADGRRLDRLAATRGLTPAGGTALFRLYRHDDAPALRQALGRAGVLVRGFAHDPQLLRFGLPGRQADWRRLETALPPP